jgi:hypothetical protein
MWALAHMGLSGGGGEESETIGSQRSTVGRSSATNLLDDHDDDDRIDIRIRTRVCPRVVSVVSLRLAI